MTETKTPAAKDRFQIGESTLRHRRLLTSLLEVVENAERVETPRRWEGRTWDQSVIALIDRPDFDSFNAGCTWEVPVVDGDVEAAFQVAGARMIDRMTGRDDLLEHDVALACGSRILVVIRNSPTGPSLTRLDGDRPQAGGGPDGAPYPDDDEVDARRISWVSTPETREMAERAFQWQWAGNKRWTAQAVALTDVPDTDRVRQLPTHHGGHGDWRRGPEVAIAVACEATLPITSDRPPLDPEHPEPLDCDVALAVAGRIHAVVRRTDAGPVVFRFRDLWPGMV